MSLPRQVLDFSTAAGHIRRERGFLVFDPADGDAVKVPLDSILSVLLSSRQVTVSTHALAALSAQGAMVLICGANMLPQALMTPVVPHGVLTARQSAQAALKDSVKKRLWQALVRCKIRAQAAAIADVSRRPLARLDRLATSVKPGDPDNCEAQAAQVYWPALMGTAFRRRPEAGDANVHLNYGYAVVRACVARAVVGAGLLPALGLHHRQARNPFVLVDDLMEPFRPVVDRCVYALGQDPGPLDKAAKARLVAVTSAQIQMDQGMVSLAQACHDMASALALQITGERDKLNLPTLTALSFAVGEP